MQNEFEAIYWAKNETIVGIDEVGRGPLCGPLVVVGVLLPIGYNHPLINDSKKLSEKRRELLFKELIQVVKFAIRIVDAKTVDALNIYRATQKAMEEIADELNAVMTLTDAMPLRNNRLHQAIIKGDQKSIHIASASIIAKVIRDKIMMGYDHLYPEYGYKKHKGYPTKLHLEMLEKYGLKPFYRMSYGPCAKYSAIKLKL